MEKSEEAKKKTPAIKVEEKKVEIETEELDDKALEDVSGGRMKADPRPGRNG